MDTSEESRRKLDLLLQYLEGPAFWTSFKQESASQHASAAAARSAGAGHLLASRSLPPASSGVLTAAKLPAAAAAGGRVAAAAAASSPANKGGVPLTSAAVQALRRVIHGSVHKSFSGEWLTSSLGFFPEGGPLSFGLRARRHTARGLYMCLQGFVLRHLLFPDADDNLSEGDHAVSTRRHHQHHHRRHLVGGPGSSNDPDRLVVAQAERSRMLVRAIVDMLWRAADGRDAVVCTLCDGDGFIPSVDILEKVQTKSFKDKPSLASYVASSISEYEKETSPGCVLLLCSVALSRGIDRLEVELERGCNGGDGEAGFGNGLVSPSLLSDRQELQSCCINLLLVGEAAAYFHNGTTNCNDDDKESTLASSSSAAQAKSAKVGVSRRSDVGFLFWDGDEPVEKRTPVGSMLKTPRHPVWVTLVDGTFGLLFNMRAELVSDWHAEHLFTLCYYNGLDVSERAFTRLVVNTRVGRQWPKSRALREEMERSMPPLEHCILTKWPDADIQWPEVARPFL